MSEQQMSLKNPFIISSADLVAKGEGKTIWTVIVRAIRLGGVYAVGMLENVYLRNLGDPIFSLRGNDNPNSQEDYHDEIWEVRLSNSTKEVG